MNIHKWNTFFFVGDQNIKTYLKLLLFHFNQVLWQIIHGCYGNSIMVILIAMQLSLMR